MCGAQRARPVAAGLLETQSGGAIENDGWERDDKWARCIIEWDVERLAGTKMSIQKI